jgi:hypothetical protein
MLKMLKTRITEQYGLKVPFIIRDAATGNEGNRANGLGGFCSGGQVGTWGRASPRSSGCD